MVVIRIIKTNVTWSFCIKHHICFYTSITSIKTNARKNFTPELPPLQLTIENEFGHCRMATKKFQLPILERLKFDHQFSNNWIFSVSILVVTKNFWSPILWHLKAFHHKYYDNGKLSIINRVVAKYFFITVHLDFDYLIDNGLISTIDLAIEISIF
jgi:hypothetical protein